MEPGRPTVKQQIEIKNKMREYFFKGFSARITSKLLGVNEKTTQKYFNDFLDYYKISTQSNVDFEKRVQEDRIKVAMFLENKSDALLLLLDESNIQLKNISLTNKNFKIYKFLTDTILRINKFLMDIQAMKTNSALTLSDAEILSKQLGDVLSKQ